ncbi:glycosyltransferase family 9 protein [Candidatus Woesearchaeota archaeon]|nr:glycosyltransferase family 9 protein [Candidatus Woesearchaeota archaeon]
MNVRLTRFLDRYIGGLWCVLLGLFPGRGKAANGKILAIQLWGIGESILTLPALHEMKNVKVLATERNRDVYRDFDVDVISTSPFAVLRYIIKNRNSYGTAIDFEEYLNVSSIISYFVAGRRVGYSHGLRSRLYTDKVKYNDRQHCSQTFMDLLKPLGIAKKVKGLTQLKYSSRDKQIVDDYLLKKGVRKKDFLVGIAVGVAESAPSRIWPKDRFAKLCDILIGAKKARIVFMGSKSEAKMHDDVAGLMKGKPINSCGEFTLQQSFYLIKRCSLLIGNDSGPMHISAAMGTRTIGLFGPNLPVRFGPLKGTGIYKGEICKYSPCINVHKGEIPNCYYRGEDYQKCMKSISVEDVVSRI